VPYFSEQPNQFLFWKQLQIPTQKGVKTFLLIQVFRNIVINACGNFFYEFICVTNGSVHSGFWSFYFVSNCQPSSELQSSHQTDNSAVFEMSTIWWVIGTGSKSFNSEYFLLLRSYCFYQTVIRWPKTQKPFGFSWPSLLATNYKFVNFLEMLYRLLTIWLVKMISR
jgi:hypothetical protein